jgi:hypothetical protein
MGFFDQKAEQLAIKFIAEFTGQHVVPKVCVPCESSHTPNWKGYCVLTDDSLFLVNKYGARGVSYSGIGGTNSWGQYPRGTKGYPTYRFGFQFNQGVGGFTIFSKTEEGGRQLEVFLNNLYTETN